MKFSTDRLHLMGLYYLAALEKFLSIHDDLSKNRINSATSSMRILLELVCKGLVIVHCADGRDLKPDRIAKLWKRQEYNKRKKQIVEVDASIRHLTQELSDAIPHLEILQRLLIQVTPMEKATFIKKLHHAVHGDIEGIRRWAEEGMNNANVRNELQWLSCSLLRFFKLGADFDIRNDLDSDSELKTAILVQYEEIIGSSSEPQIEAFFKEEVEAFKAMHES